MQRITEAIILAGGKGTRLVARVSDRPKPMALVQGRPFLAYLIEYWNKQGIEHVIFAVSHLADQVKAYFGSQWGSLRISYSDETEPLGTGGGFKKALSLSRSQDLLLMNGDSIFPVSLESLANFHAYQETPVTLVLKPMSPSEQKSSRYGQVIVHGEQVLDFLEKGQTPPSFKALPAILSTGIYLMRADFLKSFPMEGAFSFEKDFLEKQAGQKNLSGFIAEGFFIDIGVEEDFDRAQQEAFFKALFLDEKGKKHDLSSL